MASLQQHMLSAVQSRISGTFATVKPMYSVLPDGDNRDTATYTRNSSFWLKDAAEWSAICVASAFDPVFTPTCIHPRFIICDSHFHVSPNGFIGSDGVIYWAEADFVQVVAGATPIDIGLGCISRVYKYVAGVLTELGNELPAAVTPMKVLGPSFLGKVKNQNQYNIPLVQINQRREASIFITQWFNLNGLTYWQEPHNAIQDSFYQHYIGGDSGSPLVGIVNGEPVLVTCIGSFAENQGRSIIENFDAINAAMYTAVPGAAMTEVDVSGFDDLEAGAMLENICVDGGGAWATGATWSLGHKPTASENAVIGVGAALPANPASAESVGKITITNVQDDLNLSNVYPAAWEIDDTNVANITLGGLSGLTGPFIFDNSNQINFVLANSFNVPAATGGGGGGMITIGSYQ